MTTNEDFEYTTLFSLITNIWRQLSMSEQIPHDRSLDNSLLCCKKGICLSTTGLNGINLIYLKRDCCCKTSFVSVVRKPYRCFTILSYLGKRKRVRSGYKNSVWREWNSNDRRSSAPSLEASIHVTDDDAATKCACRTCR